MKIILSRTKKELMYLIDLINSDLNDLIPYYLIKINDDYYYEMYLKIEKTNGQWHYDYFNHNVRFDGKEISYTELLNFINELIKNKRDWKKKYSLNKNKQVKLFATKYLGLNIDHILEAEITEDGIENKTSKEINLTDEDDKEKFINQWINFADELLQNKYQEDAYVEEVIDTISLFRNTILDDTECFEEYLMEFPGIFRVISKIAEQRGEISLLHRFIKIYLDVIEKFEKELSDEYSLLIKQMTYELPQILNIKNFNDFKIDSYEKKGDC